MYFRYGNYVHPKDEVNVVKFEKIPIFSSRGLRVESLYRMVVRGEIQAVGQAALTAAINNLISVYAFDYYDIGLLDDSLNPTPHYLYNGVATNLTGNRIVYRSWPKGDPAEYATCRTFDIVAEAKLSDAESQITEFREQVQWIGDGSPRLEVCEHVTGPPEPQIWAQKTKQIIVQSGQIVAHTTDPTPFIPPPLFPVWEQRHKRNYTAVSPKWCGQAFKGFSIRYTYHFVSPVPLAVVQPNMM